MAWIPGFVLSAAVAAAPVEGPRPVVGRMLDVSSALDDDAWSSRRLTDGSTEPGGGWSSDLRASADSTEWCAILLDAWYVVNGVTLWSGSPTGQGLPVDFKVQFCTDLGKTWYDIPAGRFRGVDPQTTQRRFVIEFPEVVARGIRVFATRLSPAGGGKFALQLAELEASGWADPGPFRSSVGGEFDADLNNYWRFFGLGLHGGVASEPALWGLKWWGAADASCGDWVETKLYWHSDPRTRASLWHWLRTLPMDADGYVWAAESGREHLDQHRLFHTNADFINKLWACYRWEGDRELLTSVPDYGVGLVDADGDEHDLCSPRDLVQVAGGDGLVLAQTFEAADEFRAVRVKLQVQDSCLYELRCLHHATNQLVAGHTFTGTEGHDRSWTTLEFDEPAEAGTYRVELINRAPQVEGRPAIFWTHPVGWYMSAGDAYADGTSGVNGLMDEGLLDKARRAMDYLLKQEQMRGNSEGIVVITDGDHTGLPVKMHERGGPSKPSTYYDLVRSGYKDAFVNNRYIGALQAMIGLELAAGDPQRAGRLLEQLAKARAAYHKTFWNPAAGRYAGWLDNHGRMWDYGEVAINLEAIVRGAAGPEAGKSILDWVAGRRTVEGDTSRGADIYHWRFAPRKNTRGYETNGELNHWWGGWFYDFRPNRLGRGNFGNQEENGGTNAFISFYDVMARLAVQGPDDAWERFAGGERSVMREFHRDLFYRPTAEDLDHPGERYQSYVMALPECGLPVAAVLYGFLGLEPDGDVLGIRPRLPAGVDMLGAGEIEFRGREYALEVHRPDTIVLAPGAGRGWDLDLALGLAPKTTYTASAVREGGSSSTVARLETDEAGRATLTWTVDPRVKLRIERAAAK